MDFSPQSTSTTVSSSAASSTTMSTVDDKTAEHKQLFFNPVTPDISPPHPSSNSVPLLNNTGPQQDPLNFTAVTSADIQEMEHVREHLHSMLKNARSFLENDDFDATQSNATEEENQEARDDAESVTSIETAALLRKLLPNSSPLSEMQAHFADQSALTSSHGSSGTQRMFNARTTPSSSSLAGERTLMTENALLREHLERERFRRKHCEQQIQDLHGKLLELQQQLAIAVSSERKKDVMVEQLDKTLAKVVNGWKKHEAEKITVINELKREKEASEQSHQRQQEMLLQFEKELSQAVEALTKEQQKAAQAENEKQTQLQEQQKEKEKLLEFLAKEKDRTKKAEENFLTVRQENEELQQKVAGMQHNSEEHTRLKTELNSKLEALDKEFKTTLTKEKEKLDKEKQASKDAQVVLASVQTEVQRLEMELDSAVREKESLKMEMSLKEARYEANKTREETERQAELERQMTKRLEEIHDQMSRTDAEQREAHREQIKDLNKKQKEELQKQLARFHEELKKKDVKLKQNTQEYEDRISENQEKIASMANMRQHLENQRYNLTRRLQRMMQAHCEEAIQLITTNAVTLSPTSSALQGSYLDREGKQGAGGAERDTSTRAGLDFVPRPLFSDADASVNWQPGQFGPQTATSVLDYQAKVAPDAGGATDEYSLLEQELDCTAIASPEPHPNSHHVSMPPADISEKLQEQEIRQSELNHYVKMLLDRSPGQPVEEDDGQQENALMPIPRSDRAGGSGRSSQVISPINTQADADFGGMAIPQQQTSSFVTKEKSYQQAFTKGPVTNAFAFTAMEQHGHHPLGPEAGTTSTQTHAHVPHPRSVKAPVPPHTPPRRDRDPPAPTEALTPQQVGQLSRLLGMYSSSDQALPSSKQLFAYLRGLQMNSVTSQSGSDTALQNPSIMPDAGMKGTLLSERDVRQTLTNLPQEKVQLQQQGEQAKSKNKKAEQQHHNKQAHAYRQGPPPNAQLVQAPPGGPGMKPGLVRQVKQPVHMTGPPQRQPIGHETTKAPGVRAEHVSKDKKPSGKQKHSAWR